MRCGIFATTVWYNFNNLFVGITFPLKSDLYQNNLQSWLEKAFSDTFVSLHKALGMI